MPATKEGHTFFPDGWDQARIQREVDDAFANAQIFPPKTPGGSSQWSGVSPSGVRVQGWVDATGEIKTAYPVRLDDVQPPPAGVAGRVLQDATQVPREVDEAAGGPDDESGGTP